MIEQTCADGAAAVVRHRMVRNRNLPEELETLRRNLIAARVMSGLTALEASHRFGYRNSTQLSLIESGKRPTPREHAFVRQAARVYSVSTDFLLGLSPHMEIDSRVAQQHALMRGIEDVIGSTAAQFASAMIQFTAQTQPVPGDFRHVAEATDRVATALARLRECSKFDDLRGSAPLLAAIEALSTAVEPLRAKVKTFKSIDAYFEDLREGRAEPIPWLMERYRQPDIFGE
ncbi:XRE family transcriptional regulator [Paraburkholderia sp. J10-1]|uniref:XRE family transcriptional regulator n=1 Tax=Paraburkholderia sp. J10-1 TaxID=2805430 RepID=UPI002AB75661|nr:XRE family transcriptional regulator [Paraburkholderia sp. J10-1]